MRAFPLYYKGTDYWITTNGRIFDWKSKLEITKNFSDYERSRMIAACWIGEADYPLIFKDKNSKNIFRKNINYKVPNDIEILSNGNLLIGNDIFYKIHGYKYYYVSANSIFYSSFYHKFLHKKISKGSYYVKISLVNNDGARDTRAVHRLVYYSVMNIPENKSMEINHIDGRKWFNSIRNLEETTTIENIRHSLFTIKTRNSLWNENEIDTICKMLDTGFSINEIYKNNEWIRNKISYDSFKILSHHLINHTKFWIDISSKYNFEKWHSSLKLYSDEKVHQICKLLESGKTPKEIEKILNIPLKYISNIKTRSARTKISKFYNF